MSKTDFWKTHPIVNLIIFGHDTGRPSLWKTHPTKIDSVLFKSGVWARTISRKLIQNRTFSQKMNLEFRGVTQTDFWKFHPNMDEFSKNRSSSCHDILEKLNKYSQKIDGWTIQKSVQLMPENWNFEKILDEFLRNQSVSQPGKLKLRENFWMSFPAFANKGSPRNELDRIYGKFIHKNLWVPFQFLWKSSHEPDHITGKLIQSSIFKFRGMTQAVSLENSSKAKHEGEK